MIRLFEADEKIAVILMGFGGPDSLEAVGPFMERLTGRAPSDEMVGRVQAKYSAIGGRSPLLEITSEQARLLGKRISPQGDFKVVVGMKYWNPFIEDVLDQLADEGFAYFVAFPMAPFSSEISTGAYAKAVDDFSDRRKGVNFLFVSPWHNDPLFIDTIASGIAVNLKDFSEKPRIIFSVHNLPESFETESYKEQVNGCSRRVMEIVGDFDWSVAFQSKGGGPGKWIEPELSSALMQTKDRGFGGVLLVPIGFTCDHVETLYDLDIEARNLCKTLGLTFSRTPAPNVNPIFIQMMEKKVIDAMKSGRKEGDNDLQKKS